MTRVVVGLLAWWFAMNSPSTSIGRVVGPFRDQAACDAVRKEMDWRTTSCWWDGKP